MQQFLHDNGIEAVPKRIYDGSLKNTWRLYNPGVRWSVELANQLTALGFASYNGRPLDGFDGNGGMFSVFVRGHEELLQEDAPAVESGPMVKIAPVTKRTPAERLEYALQWYLSKAEKRAVELKHLPLACDLVHMRSAVEAVIGDLKKGGQ